MLKQSQVQRYTHESGLKDLMIAEREIVLTFVLQLLTEKGLLKKLAFKGGTCIRKMFLGTTGRFSTDLDFTCLTDEQPDDLILELLQAFEQPSTAFNSRSPTEAGTQLLVDYRGQSTRSTVTNGTREGTASSSFRSAIVKRQRSKQ